MKKDWVLLEECTGSFYELKLVIATTIGLDKFEIGLIAGCTGYALRSALAGEDLSEPLSAKFDILKNKTVIRFSYDGTKSRRDDPDYVEAVQKIRQYVKDGTPVRKTNQAGPDTKGTRLVEGCGLTDVKVYVR